MNAHPGHPTPFVVAWYRPSQRRAIARVALAAAALVTLGSLTLALAWRAPTAALTALATGLGGLATLAGPCVATWGLLRILSRDDYLLLRSDGVVLAQGGDETFVPWTQLSGAMPAAEVHGVALQRVAGPPLIVPGPFDDVDPPTLARRLNHVRRQALRARFHPA